MGRGAERYTDEQREAVVRAVATGEMSSAKAAEAAACGELGVPAFEIPASTIRHLAQEAQKHGLSTARADLDREIEAGAFAGSETDRWIASIYKRLIGTLEHAAERTAAKAETAPVRETCDAIRAMGRALKELHLGIRRIPPPTDDEPDNAEPGLSDETAELIDRIDAAMQERDEQSRSQAVANGHG